MGTARPIHLTTEEMRKIIEMHDGLPSTHSAAAQQVYDETCVGPFFNTMKLLAPLAAGSRERYDELKPEVKKAARNTYGPPPKSVEYDSNLIFRPINVGIGNAIPGTVNPDDPTFLSLGPKRSFYEAMLHKANTVRFAGIEDEDPELIPNYGDPISKTFMSMDPKVVDPGKNVKMIEKPPTGNTD